MNITQAFIESIDRAFEKEIPEHVFLKAKRAFLDYICVTVAGAKTNKEKLDKFFIDEKAENGDFKAIGVERLVNLKDAVFLNGLNAHTLDFDDGTNKGIIHLGSPIFSVLLPLAQKYKITLREFLKAAIIGYEVSFTMAVSIQPLHKEMGYHATGTCGILGIVIAAAYMLKMNPKERYEAFSIACVSSSGMLKVLEDSSQLKPYNVAKTALLGIVSFQMARMGMHGNEDALGGNFGFLKMMTGENGIELKRPLIDGTYAIEKTYTKPYAACRYCHPSIEAAINISARYGLNAENINNIVIRTYYWAVSKHDHTDIKGSASAKMSIPYGVAVGIIYRKAGLSEYDDAHAKDENILSLAKKVSVVDDEELTKSFPEKTTAIVQVFTNDGKEYSKRVDYPKGEPENPFTNEEFITRYNEMFAFSGKDAGIADEILKTVNEENDMYKLFELL